MSFREKRIWVSFVLLLLVAAFYFGNVYMAFSENDWQSLPDGSDFSYFALYLIALFVACEIVFHIVLMVLSPKEARTPKDERERSIELRAIRIAYTVLLVEGIVMAFFVIHHGMARSFNWWMGNLIVFAIVIAQLVKYGLQIYYHRRES